MATWSLYATEDGAGADGTSYAGITSTTGGMTFENVLGGGCQTDGGGNIEGITAASQVNAMRTTAQQGDNQAVKVGSTNNLLLGPMVRVQADGTGYMLGAASKFGAWTLYDITAATTRSVIASGRNRTGTEAAELRFEGTAYEAWLGADASADFTGTDAGDTYPSDGNGNPGVGCWSNAILCDDWAYYEDTDEGGGGLSIPIVMANYRQRWR